MKLNELIEKHVLCNIDFAPEYIQEIKKNVEQFVRNRPFDSTLKEKISHLIHSNLDYYKSKGDISEYSVTMGIEEKYFGTYFAIKVMSDATLKYDFYKLELSC